jgi:hypothetical protein
MTWFFMAIPGMGQILVWADLDSLRAGGFVEAKNLTQLVPDRSGRLGFQKMSDAAMLNMALVAFYSEAIDELKTGVANLWNRVIAANNGDVKRIIES